jgi:hypothetical protein
MKIKSILEKLSEAVRDYDNDRARLLTRAMLGSAPVTGGGNEKGADPFGLDADSAVSKALRLVEEARAYA